MIKLNDDKHISYDSSGLFRSSGKWIHPVRNIDTYVMIFVIKGNFRIFEEDSKYELHENDIFLLEPGKTHGGCEITDNDISYYWVHFHTNIELPLKIVTSDNTNSLKTMFSQLMHISNTPGYSENTYDIICGLIIEEVLFAVRQEKNIGSSLASEIKEYIRLNICKDITVGTIAAHFGYHENYIGKVFKNFYGTGMKQYIADMKLKKTQDYLLTTLYTVKEIAYMNGFKSENHFIKFFKYHTDMTPTEYRNIYINTHINNS